MVAAREPELTQTAWLFTREHESVRVQVEDSPQGYLLIVMGPGENSASYDFGDAAAVDEFRQNYERDLVSRGFRLQAVAERRRTDDRRQSSRTASRERRR
jgi:hypothetical protein